MARQFNGFDPRWIGIAISVGTSAMLVLSAERYGVESMVGLIGLLLMGLHMALSPHVFRVRPGQIAHEEPRDRYPLLSTFSFAFLGAYLVIEYLVTG